MKKQLSLILSALLVVSSAITTMAFEPETVETVAEQSEIAAQAELSDDAQLDIPLIDADKGKLIFYQNFDSEGATASTVDYADATYLGVGTITGSGTTLTVVEDPADASNKVLKMTCGNGSWHQYVVGLDLPLSEGTYTVSYRHAGENGDIAGYMQRFFTTPNPVNSSGQSKDDLLSVNISTSTLNSNPKTWYNASYSGVCKTVDGLLKFGMSGSTPFPMSGDVPMQKIRELRLIPYKGNLYVDDFCLYYFPEDAFTVSDGTSVELIVTDDEFYTFPETDGVYFYADKNDFSKTYLPGDEVPVGDLAGGKFVAVRVPLYAADKGELVLYMDYENGNVNDFTYSNPRYTNLKSFSNYRSDGTQSISLVTDPTDANNHALRVYSNNTATWRLAVPEFGDIAIANSAFTIDSRFMLVNPSVFNQLYFRFTNVGGGDHTASATMSLASNPPAENTWKSVSLSPNNKAGVNKGLRSFGYQMNMKSGVETTYYVDDYAVYVYPQNSVMLKPSKDSTEFKFLRNDDLHGEDLSFTFPELADVGYAVPEDERFFGWASMDGKQVRKPGETVKYADLDNQVFYPFSQSINDSAMGYAFEGALSMSGSDNQTLRYKEELEDDGRSVLHFRTYKSFNKQLQGGKWATDSRIGMKVGEDDSFYGSEFPIVTYTYKIENTYKVPDTYVKDSAYDPTSEDYADAQPIALSESKFVFWYYKKNAAGSIWLANNGENKLGNSYQTAIIDGKYHTLTLDMTKLDSNKNDPYLSGKVYGFGLDPVSESSWSADIYIDSIRAYRSGFTTVTYNTNAPEGAAVVYEVAPDTGRGLGKGYLLSDEHPEVEGYTFAGWALTADATAADVVEAIDLTDDTTVYAVWTSASKTEIPAMSAASSVYLSDNTANNGIRFRADIAAEVVANEDLREYGFLVARKDMLDKYLDTLTHSFYLPTNKPEDPLKPLYVEGKAFEKDAEGNILKNYVYRVGEDGAITFVARCIGLDITNKAQVTAELTARPYLRYVGANGRTVTLYGDTYTSSLYKAVKAIKDRADAGDTAASEEYELHKAYIDSILALGE